MYYLVYNSEYCLRNEDGSQRTVWRSCITDLRVQELEDTTTPSVHCLHDCTILLTFSTIEEAKSIFTDHPELLI
jgi:hypothetical protein